MDMNTSSLLLEERRQEQSAKDFDLLGPGIIEDLIDDLLREEPIGKIRGRPVNLFHIVDGEGVVSDEEFSNLVHAVVLCDRDRLNTLCDALVDRAKQRCRIYLEGYEGAMIVESRVRQAVREGE